MLLSRPTLRVAILVIAVALMLDDPALNLLKDRLCSIISTGLVVPVQKLVNPLPSGGNRDLEVTLGPVTLIQSDPVVYTTESGWTNETP